MSSFGLEDAVSSYIEPIEGFDDPLAPLKACGLLREIVGAPVVLKSDLSYDVDAIIKEAAEQAQAEERTGAPTLAHFLNRNGLKPMVIVYTSTLPAPFNDRDLLETFLRTGNVAVTPHLQTQRATSSWTKFTVPISSGGTTVNISFVDSSLVTNFTKKHWYSVIGVMVSTAEWPFRSMPFKSISQAALHIRILYIKWEDNLPVPPHLANLPVSVLRFQRSSRHVDRLVWRDLGATLLNQLDRPYDFSYISFNRGVDPSRNATRDAERQREDQFILPGRHWDPQAPDASSDFHPGRQYR